MAEFRIFRSDDSVLIRGGGIDIEVSHEDAVALHSAIGSALGKGVLSTRIRWTDARLTELRHLHQEGLAPREISLRMGITKQAVTTRLSRLGLVHHAAMSRAAIARRNARKAA